MSCAAELVWVVYKLIMFTIWGSFRQNGSLILWADIYGRIFPIMGLFSLLLWSCWADSHMTVPTKRWVLAKIRKLSESCRHRGSWAQGQTSIEHQEVENASSNRPQRWWFPQKKSPRQRDKKTRTLTKTNILESSRTTDLETRKIEHLLLRRLWLVDRGSLNIYL